MARTSAALRTAMQMPGVFSIINGTRMSEQGVRVRIFRFRTAALICALLAAPFRITAAPSIDVANFRLFDTQGRMHELYRHSDAKAIVLISYANACQILRRNLPTIKTLRRRFRKQGVVFLMIAGSIQDEPEEILRESQEFGIQIPILLNPAQHVMQGLAFTRTSEALLIDSKNWSIVYRGAVDDLLDYDGRKPKATRHYLADAIAALIHGTEIRRPKSRAMGCFISKIGPATVSYKQTVRPILVARCASCHKEGNAMRGLEEARRRGNPHPWRPFLRRLFWERRLPAEHPEFTHSHKTGIRPFTMEEVRILIAWLRSTEALRQ